MNYIKELYSRIESGEIKTSEDTKALYKRLCEDMDDPNSDFYFDEDRAVQAVINTAALRGKNQGRETPLGLSLFQAFYGFFEKKTGQRRFYGDEILSLQMH